MKLKKKLESKGYEFVSETDTEIIAHLLDYYYKGDPLETIAKIMHRMEGSYALGIMFSDQPDKLYAVRKDSPLIVGRSSVGNLIASDVPAVLKYTRDVYFIENEEIVCMTKDDITFYNIDEEELEKTPTTCSRRCMNSPRLSATLLIPALRMEMWSLRSWECLTTRSAASARST